MEEKTVIRGIKGECLVHICQDDLCLHEFLDWNGDEVWVGALSDGCSGALGSENGSAFLVRAFTEEAERLGKDNQRNGQLLRRVALALVNRMAEYEPKDPGSEIRSYNGLSISDELCATLYGFIADKKKILLLLAGNGYIAINGHRECIDQLEQDVYPTYLTRFPRKTWEKKLEEVFVFAEFPADRIRDFVLASDGFKHPNPNEYPGLTEEPAMFILQAQYNATKAERQEDPNPSSCREDDATAISFARIGPLKNPVGLDETADLCRKMNHLGNSNFWKQLKGLRKSVIRPMLRKVDPMDDPSFRRNLSESEGVYLFGITDEEKIGYENRKNQIIQSRVRASESDIWTSLFGKKTSSDLRTRRSFRKPDYPGTGKKHSLEPIETRQGSKKTEAPIDVSNGCVLARNPLIRMTPITTDVETKVLEEKFGGQTMEPDDLASIARVKMLPIFKDTGIKKDQGRRNRKKGDAKEIKPEEEWKKFQELCSYRLHRRHRIGFRQFGRVMYDLWYFVENCHNQGLRLGNLRPQDLLFKIQYEKNAGRRYRKPIGFEFFLVNPEATAKVNTEKKIVRNYTGLDLNFVHPDYASRMATDDNARLEQDWYAFSVLCTWFVTKFDPLGTGKIIAKPEANRIYRMENVLLSQSSSIEIDERKRLFIKRAFERLSPKVEEFIREFIERKNFQQSPYFLLKEFSDENIITCKGGIFKRDKRGKAKRERCGFKQLKGFESCGYCGAPHVKMISASHQLYQTEDRAATI